MSRVLIVDDEPSICWAFRESLSDAGHDVETVSTAEDALRSADAERPDVVVMDVRLPGMDGLSALHKLRDRLGSTPIIIMTAFGSLDTAVQAVEAGAFDYLPKPFDLNQAISVVRNALSGRQHTESVPETDVAASTAVATLVGKSPAMQALYRQIALVAASDVPVLITGESGTGKELVAEAIHRNSGRGEGPFVPVCVPALSPTVVEAELFGHTRGSFTGADRDRPGLLDLADGGTVFLDEVGDVPLAQQVKLLRAMDRREVTPVGGGTAHRSNFRLIAATNQDLEAQVRLGEFRDDLYYRLNVFRIHVPRLSDRRDDIPLLAGHFLQTISPANPKQLADETIAELTGREWPGNVRELRNAIEHAAVVARGHVITPDCLPRPFEHGLPAGHAADAGLEAALRAWAQRELQDGAANAEALYEDCIAICDRVLLREALAATDGNASAAAKLLGIHRQTLRQKLRNLGDDAVDAPDE
jgi:two-component system, NtrC family, nitrogen regulation response regulator GlnG